MEMPASRPECCERRLRGALMVQGKETHRGRKSRDVHGGVASGTVEAIRSIGLEVRQT